MNENREIEEMARKIDYAINHECKLNNGESCEDCQYDNNGDWNCQSQMMATYLQGEGYRNCKDKVVLDEEEYVENDRLMKLLEEKRLDELKSIHKIFDKVRKETAKEIFQKLIGYTIEEDGWTWCISKENIEEIIKQYGVEL